MIKAVLFDFDDTLVKTKEIRYEAIKAAGKKFYKLALSDKDIDKHWGKPFDIFISGVFKNLDSVESLIKNYSSILHKYPNGPFPGTDTVLKLLSNSYLLGVISSSNPGLILSGMSDVGISPNLFFFVQSSYDTDIHKPDPKVFAPALEKLQSKSITSPHGIIYVGDALDDYSAAKNAGLYFCGLANHTVNETVFIEKSIPHVKDISQLPGYIKGI